jgi:hypothetical protein
VICYAAFLQYSSADRTSVIAVQKLLKARGITTFLDTGSSDKTARLCLLQVNDLVDPARTIIGRNFLLMNRSSIFQARSTARRFPTYRGQTRKCRKAIEVFKVFHAEKSRKIISQKSQILLFPYPAKNVTYYISQLPQFVDR